jgi:flagellar biosynthesis/type III secretory pathway protein FliH
VGEGSARCAMVAGWPRATGEQAGKQAGKQAGRQAGRQTDANEKRIGEGGVGVGTVVERVKYKMRDFVNLCYSYSKSTCGQMA